ncbi:MAG: beta-N-acetylglucosaminidase domain-containing protein [Nitrospira sp.]
MVGIGIIEGFFGPEWSWKSRHQFCESLQSYGGEFYLYAPKRDSHLRRQWEQDHPTDVWNELKRLSVQCHRANVAFGIGLSPFEIYSRWNEKTKRLLREKVQKLEELDITYLGLFFDDMRGSSDLAEKQLEIVNYVRSNTDKTLLFCPTYYSDDPLLDQIFGQRSPHYLQQMGTLSADIQIFWTGSNVISKSISAEELKAVAGVLQRKPMIWDNYFANDGPKQCRFLKLKPLEGRNRETFKSSVGWAFNLMNQPSLSETVFASSVDVLQKGTLPSESFYDATQRLAGAELASSLKAFGETFVTLGLDTIDVDRKVHILSTLSENRFSRDIVDWLDGKYLVGDECLTD